MHQTSSPGRAPSQCSACRRWPSRYRCPCTTAFGSPEVPLVNVIRQGSSGASSTAGADGSPPANRASSGTSARGHRQLPRLPLRARPGCARRRRSAGAARRADAGGGPSRAAARCTAARPRRCRKQAHIVNTHSGRLPIRSSRRRRGRSRAPAACPPARRCVRPPRRSSTRAGSRRAKAPRARASTGAVGRRPSGEVHGGILLGQPENDLWSATHGSSHRHNADRP